MNSNYTLRLENGVGIVTSSLLDGIGIKHGFTTRLGGVSEKPIDSLNLGFNRPEPRENIVENYRRLCNAYGLNFESLVLVSYAHGTNVVKVTAKDCGRGISLDKDPLPECDGIITNDPNVTLFTLHADCSAFFVADPIKRAIGLAHAGWRGTYGRIGKNLIDRMVKEYDCNASDMFAVVSPCICGDCYEVSEDVADMFVKEYDCKELIKPHARKGKFYLDIRRAARLQFIEAGLPKKQIADINSCTFENEDLFYSYRRSGRDKTGAMGAFLTLKD